MFCERDVETMALVVVKIDVYDKVYFPAFLGGGGEFKAFNSTNATQNF